MNSFASKHWKRFANENYFSGNGEFWSAVVSAPLLFSMFLILINYLILAVGLLVEMKKKELKYKARERYRKEQGNTKKQQ